MRRVMKITLLGVVLIAVAGILPVMPLQAATPCDETETIVYGDTLVDIAERCNTSVDALLAANPHIDNTRSLPVGLELQIPTGEEPAQTTYVVKRGDTLFGIASRFDTSILTLMEANPDIINPGRIYVGQRLTIPGQPPRRDQPAVTVQPQQGRVGDTVLVDAETFPPNTPVVIGFGRPNSEYDVIAHAETSRAGSLDRTVTVPDFVEPNDDWVVVVATADREMTAAAPFDVLPERQGEPMARIAPQSGPAGAQVMLTASGFPADTRVNIGVGRKNAEVSQSVHAFTDVGGRLQTDVAIPGYAEIGEPWVVVVSVQNQRIKAISNAYTVTENTVGGTFERTNIYLIAPGDDGQTGTAIGCGDSVVPAEVQIEPTVAPMTAAFEKLLSLDSREYGQSGLYNALHASDLRVESVDIDNREAQIRLSGTLSPGGTCDTPRIEAQLRQTALQYSTVDSVSITINGESLESVLSLR